ncbi:pathogenesis-related protein PRB1-3-like [Jatropha curcas]|uniref:pathogenesis-related protein PRB1-3-like n=1 Tax=Jatropha curcas TaxID=180498 RepID=UPI0018951395|nr:pathogenesis-related protein PRB1-3-like [Jatropha curcas]
MEMIGTFLLLSLRPILSFSAPVQEICWSRRLLVNKSSSESINGQFLIPHNIERAKLGLPPLKWSNKIAKFASTWPRKRGKDCAFIHSNSHYGENLFWGSRKDRKPGDTVAAWAAEKCYYNHMTNTCTENKDCLHYTQMVWKQSLELGCARVICASGDTFFTCNYHPHGNVIGEKPF